MKTVTATYYVGDAKVTLTSYIHDNEVGDTKVEVDGELLCFVAGNERHQFINDFKALVSKYAI